MKKSFDCVEMKHRGAADVQARLSTMTVNEQADYWRNRAKEIEDRRDKLAKKKAS